MYPFSKGTMTCKKKKKKSEIITCSKMEELVETHLGYTALTNELKRCFHSMLLIFRRANSRLVGSLHHLFAKQKSNQVL